MNLIRIILAHFSKKERVLFALCLTLAFAGGIGLANVFIETHTEIVPVHGGSWIEGVVGAPSIVNPIFSSSEADQVLSFLIYGSFDRLIEIVKEENPLTYTVTLKENLFWSDGKPLTADDVVFTVETIQNPDMRSSLFRNWQGIETQRVSELQVKFILPSPYVFFEKNLRRLQIVPKHIWENVARDSARFSRFSLEPVGSGPFAVKRVVKRQDGSVESYRLEQNPYFPGDKPYLKNFSVFFYENEEALIRAFRGRTVNGFAVTTPFSENLLVQNGVVKKVPMSRYYAVFFNPNKNPALGDKNLRLALDRATSRTEIKEKIFNGNATIVDGPAVYEERLFSDAPEAFNMGSGKEFFVASKETSTTLVLTVPDTPFLIATADILKARWEEVGLEKVELKIMNPVEMFETIRNGNYEAILFGNILENPRDLFSFWHSSQRGYPGLNLSFYASSEADKLLEEIRATKNEFTQDAKLQSLELLITDDVPAVFLYSVPLLYTHEERLGGFNVSRAASSPAERLTNVADWYVMQERVIK